MEYFGKSRCGNPLPFERSADPDPVALRLCLHAELVPLECDTQPHSLMELLLIITRSLDRLLSHPHEGLGLREIKVSLCRGEHRLLPLRLKRLIRRSHQLPGGQGIVNRFS